MKTLVLNSIDIETLVDLAELRGCMADALMAISSGTAISYQRTAVSLDTHAALGFMPAHETIRGILGYKTASIFYNNIQSGLNPHQGLVILLDKQTGLVKCILEASTITALRTAAVSAAATELLSRKDSTQMALIGAGRQAFEHVKAIAEIRQLEKISLFSKSGASAQSLAMLLQSQYPFKISIHDTPASAARDADIIVTCTPARQALLDINEVRDGTHINAIGACRPGFQEISLRTHARLKIYLDSSSACQLEADEITQPQQAGLLSADNIIGEIGQCLLLIITARQHQNEITLFKSVGLGIEDIIAADYFYKKALSANIGQTLQL